MLEDHLNNPAFVRAFANAILKSKLKQNKSQGDITNNAVVPKIIEVPPITEDNIPKMPIFKPRPLMAIDITEPALVATKSIPIKSKLSKNYWWILGGLGLVGGGFAIYYWGFYLPKKRKDETK
jgi:hypothetical protein